MVRTSYSPRFITELLTQNKFFPNNRNDCALPPFIPILTRQIHPRI